MKRHVNSLIALFLWAYSASASEAVHGLWVEPGMGAVVRLDYCEDGSSLCGRVLEISDASRRYDQENPDPAMRGRDLLGQFLLWDFKPDGQNRWLGGGGNGALPGRIYLPLNGDTLGDARNTYELVYDGDNSLTIRKQGCWACLLSSQWRRK